MPIIMSAGHMCEGTGHTMECITDLSRDYTEWAYGLSAPRLFLLFLSRDSWSVFELGLSGF